MGRINFESETPGLKYNKLTVVGYSGTMGMAKKQRMVECECECGNRKNIVKAHLISGEIKSCGCLAAESARIRATKRTPSKASAYFHYNTYRLGAKARGIAFCLSEDEFLLCSSGDCAYCGAEPEEFLSRQAGERKPSGYFANGVDRVDNGIGYVVGNIVPCCSICNKSKHTKTKDQFIEMCKAVAAHNP